MRDLNQTAFFEKELKRAKGIADISISAAGSIRLEYDLSGTDRKQILDLIKKKGIAIKSVDEFDRHQHEKDDGMGEEQKEDEDPSSLKENI